MRLIRLLKYDLAREVTTWVGEDLISTEQAKSICSRYGVDYHDISRRSYGYQILVGFGYLFIGLALITLIGANWDEIPRAARMSGLVALTLGANLLGLSRFRQDKTSAAVAWFFLGGLFYGASIMLIAQIYHIGEHFPDGIFWWALGILPFAVLLQSAQIMILAVSLGFIWFFTESSLNFYPTLFPLFLVAMIWFLGRGRQSNILFLMLIAGLGLWAEYTLSWFMNDKPGFQVGSENVALGVGLFVVFHGLSKWLVERKEGILADYGTLLAVYVLRFTIITLFIFSFEEPWRSLIKQAWHMPGVTIVLSLLLCALALWLVYRTGKSMVSTGAYALLFIVALLAVMQVDNRAYGQAFQFADNIVLVAMGVWLIVRGIRDSISHYFYAGLLAILVTGLMRYFDFVGDYIGAAILFAIFAAILLISGPLAVARSRFAHPLIVLRDVPIEFNGLRSRSAYQTQSSRPPSGFAPLGRLARKIALKCNFRPQPTAAHLAARWVEHVLVKQYKLALWGIYFAQGPDVGGVADYVELS